MYVYLKICCITIVNGKPVSLVINGRKSEKSVRKQLALNDILGEMEFKGMYRILILLRCTWNIPR